MTSDEIQPFLDRFLRACESQGVKTIGSCHADDGTVAGPTLGMQLGVLRAKPH